MEKSEAISLIKEIIQDLNTNPDQFITNINIRSIGTNVVASNGGTGISVSAVGGGPGSKTIGYKSSVSTHDINTSKGIVDDKIKNDILDYSNRLAEIISELEAEKINNHKIHQIIESLKMSWIPGVVTSVVGNIVFKLLTP